MGWEPLWSCRFGLSVSTLSMSLQVACTRGEGGMPRCAWRKEKPLPGSPRC